MVGELGNSPEMVYNFDLEAKPKSAPVSEVGPAGVPIGTGRPQATRKALHMRRVGSNHDPGVLSDHSGGFQSENWGSTAFPVQTKF